MTVNAIFVLCRQWRLQINQLARRPLQTLVLAPTLANHFARGTITAETLAQVGAWWCVRACVRAYVHTRLGLLETAGEYFLSSYYFALLLPLAFLPLIHSLVIPTAY
jgi:hypothetical protein